MPAHQSIFARMVRCPESERPRWLVTVIRPGLAGGRSFAVPPAVRLCSLRRTSVRRQYFFGSGLAGMSWFLCGWHLGLLLGLCKKGNRQRKDSKQHERTQSAGDDVAHEGGLEKSFIF